ncbi:Phosphotransferase family protein [Aspergillus mulundensis]|uniref:Phosphotransferase family protein n=1 Tax=Aspergillus mulundensis TaxID=1810919 RepID=A0A3D8SL57_9EURO|nr:Phosphotransferase family protein [Aspergillus mulundensis]RDW87043.1 Phosphotransferase family protein [Aspergillus mulundensis]
MGWSLVPSILTPDYTWPAPLLSSVQRSTPPVPPIPSSASRRIWGIIHKGLEYFSRWYCHWYGIYDPYIIHLPFGLVLKWTNRTSLGEVAAMQMVRAAGIPAPKVISVGEHPNAFLNRNISILMTRLPGITLDYFDDNPLDDEIKDPWLEELKICVEAMRCWEPPCQDAICSPIGTELRSSRVPDHVMGPFKNHTEFYDHLFYPASRHGFDSDEEYEEAFLLASRLRQRPYQLKFTHGDFKRHNILVDDDGHLAGFLDWESGGWYPEYWEFTTAMRFGSLGWWYQVASWMGGDQYLDELASDKALNALTVDSYIFMP